MSQSPSSPPTVARVTQSASPSLVDEPVVGIGVPSEPSESPVALSSATIVLSLTGLPCGEMGKSNEVEFEETLDFFLGNKLDYEIESVVVLETDNVCDLATNASRILIGNNVIEVTSLVRAFASTGVELLNKIHELFKGDDMIEFVELLRVRDLDDTYFSLINDADVRYTPSSMPSVAPIALSSSDGTVPNVPDDDSSLTDNSSATMKDGMWQQKAPLFFLASFYFII